MDNAETQRNRCNQNKSTKLCSINIDGLSSKSRLLLDKYANDENFGIIFAQENGPHEIDKMKLTNMKTVTDTNSSKNRGALLYIHDSIPHVNLPDISEKSTEIDSAWAVAIINKKKYIVGSIYVKHHYPDAIKDALTILNHADMKRKSLKAQGIILAGDFNARHPAWGDSKTTSNGKKLFEQLDHTEFKICTAKSPTFLCVDGSSHIDLMLVSVNMVDKISAFHTDNIVELGAGAPDRGHVPLITSLNECNPKIQVPKEKLDVEKTNWDEWSQNLENSISSNECITEDPYTIWEFLETQINQVNSKHCKTKKVTHHSKPYWTPNLTILCNRMRKARRAYVTRNTDPRKQLMIETKQLFDEERKKACDNFILQKTTNLNTADSLKFWKEFNSLFKKKVNQGIEPLFGDDGGILTDATDIESKLFSTFFESRHISNGNFDDLFYETINAVYHNIQDNNYNIENPDEFQQKLNARITIKEIKWAIKNTKCGNKSVDNHNIHPKMLHCFGPNTLKLIQKLFNRCLDEGEWVWKTAKVIFLKKSGKDSYAVPGSYRPISISSYIGKLLEKILAARLTLFLEARGIFDANQEGFTANRNTIRYLNRLHLEIKSDILENKAVMGLFIDFEKAFDSVWKKGLLYKMFNLEINGNVLRIIDNFLHTRKVQLDVNGNVGDLRNSNQYGLPQGSALSPVLFKIYLLDILDQYNSETNIRLFKFADDGTVKVTADSTNQCLNSLKSVLDSIQEWTMKWRMVVNCDTNKTEFIVFGTADDNAPDIPNSINLGRKEIKRVTTTKVLGLTIDENLTYEPHSKKVNQKICGSWVSMCEHTNRNYGFNQRVITQITKTYFLSSAHYAGLIWQNSKSLKELQNIWYKIIKSAVGAVFNVRQSLLEVILGLPPLDLQNLMNKIKHFLKLNIRPAKEDKLREFIQQCLSNRHSVPVELREAMKEVYKFLKWKLQHYAKDFNENDINIIQSLDYSQYFLLSSKSCNYTKQAIALYLESLWHKKLKNEFLTEGIQHPPKPSCKNLPIPRNTPRKDEVLLMSLMYPNNLFNDFLWRHTYQVQSPLCQKCNLQEETPYHIIFQCSNRSNDAKTMLRKILSEDEISQEDSITILNGSRQENFIKLCLEILSVGNYREEIALGITV